MKNSYFNQPWEGKALAGVMRPRGSMLLETAVACVLLAALAGVCLKSFAAAAAQRLAIDQRQIALREASNLMEKITAMPWDEIDKTADKTYAESLQKSLPKELDGAEISVEVVPAAGEPAAKRLAVSLRWKDKDNQWVAPVRLTVWRYRR
jgi:Tfp pilus assembly protein PilE